jgi:hypothetical protein
MSGWNSRNPQPTEPTFNENPPTAPSGNNIQCCSQLFSDISAASVNFTNIQQQCSQTIQNQINDATRPPPTTPPPTTPPPTTRPPTTRPPTTPPPTTQSLAQLLEQMKIPQEAIIFFIILVIILSSLSLFSSMAMSEE